MQYVAGISTIPWFFVTWLLFLLQRLARSAGCSAIDSVSVVECFRNKTSEEIAHVSPGMVGLHSYSFAVLYICSYKHF